MQLLQVDIVDVGDPLELLQAGSIRSVEYSGGHVLVDAPRPGRVYLPGSFNPLHDGHRHAAGPVISLHELAAAIGNGCSLCCGLRLCVKFRTTFLYQCMHGHTTGSRPCLPANRCNLHLGGHHWETFSRACRRLLDVAAEQAQAEGCFELSIGNPDKGMLPLDQVRQRVKQFTAADLPVVVVQVRSVGPAYRPFETGRTTDKFWSVVMESRCWS